MFRRGDLVLLVAIILLSLTTCGIKDTTTNNTTPIERPEATVVKGPRVKRTGLVIKEGMEQDDL